MAITRAQQARQMLKNGNFVMQGGVKNYLGKQKTVNNVPVKWQSGPDKPATELAYITKAEKDLLLKKDIHGSLKDGPNMGPGGLMSLDSAGSGYGGPGPGKSSSGGGKDKDDKPSKSSQDFRSSNVMNPMTQPNVKSLTDLKGGRLGGSEKDDDKSALKDTGTGKYRLVTSGDDLYDYNLTKDFVQGNLDYQGGKKPSGRDLRLAGASPLQVRNARYRANMIDRFIRTKRNRLLAELELAGIEGAENLTDSQLSELFATGNLGSAVNLNDILADSSQAGIFDKSKIRYTKGGTFDPTSPIYGGPPQPYVGTGNPITDAIFGRFGKAASGPVTTQGLEKLYEQYKNLQEGFTTDLVDGEYQKGDPIDLATMNRDDLMKEFSPNAYAVEKGLLYNPRTGTFTKKNDDGPGDQILFPQDTTPGDGDDDDDTNTGGLAFRFMSRGGSPMDAPKKEGIMKASYGYDDAMGEAFEEFLRLKKIKEIPEDMEFDEYLDQLDIDVPYSKKDKGEQRTMAQEGGIMDLETGRQMYFLGKLVKKATRAVKKIAKSPIGKAALMFGIPGTGFGGLFGRASFGTAAKGLFGKYGIAQTLGMQGLSPGAMGGKKAGLGGLFERILGFAKDNPILTGGSILALLPFLTEEEQQQLISSRGVSIDPGYIRGNPMTFASQVGSGSGTAFALAADGGRIGYQEGSKEPVAKKTMPLLDMDGKEMDLRDDGGFVPIGRMEKADDVPARLSKNEFVFTADAVRNAGGGDVDKGAEVMYNMMKNLESGGEVSEESQGLEGAREMFQTSKRLEEVL